jgi:excisionase family DNA binding protein
LNVVSSKAMAKTTKLFTIAEAAKELKCSRAALYQAIDKGRLKATPGETVKVVKTLLIAEKDLKAFRLDEAQQRRGKKN